MANVVNIKLRKSDERRLNARMEKANHYVGVGAREGLREFARKVINRSQPLVPVWTGAMKSTYYIRPPRVSKNRTTIDFGYDGTTRTNPRTGIPVSEYLMKQHEDLSLNHPRGGQAKFFEQPLVELQTEFLANMGNNIWKALGTLRNR